MGNYTLQTESNSLNEVTSKQDDTVLIRTVTTTKEYKERLGKTGGMRIVQTRTLYQIFNEIVHSNLDMKLVSYMLDNTTLSGEVKEESSKKIAGVNYLANRFGVTRKKVSQILARCIDAELIKKNKRTIIVNPYIQSPYRTSNDGLYILQVWWDSDFTRDIAKELHEANTKYEEYLNQKIDGSSIENSIKGD